MKSFEIDKAPSLKKAHHLFLVGADPVVLSNEYDPDQLWFDFMAGVIFQVPEQPIQLKPKPRKLNKTSTFARQEHRALHVYKRGVEQYPLRFPDRMRLSNARFKELVAAGAPTWTRNAEWGTLHTVHIRERPFDPAEWCTENFDGFFHCGGRIITCELEIDAIRAKLVFS